jgi:hypothetical protein
MRIEDILGCDEEVRSTARVIIRECSQFLRETAGIPVLKQLPLRADLLQKVKVRHQKRTDCVAEAFSKAFNTNLRQRAIFAYGNPPMVEGSNPCYIFPIDGYKFLYSREVQNSTTEYQQVLNTLFESLDGTKAVEIVTDLVKYTYIRENLIEGIMSDSEIIFYGIPYYYAVRVESCPTYSKLLNT